MVLKLVAIIRFQDEDFAFFVTNFALTALEKRGRRQVCHIATPARIQGSLSCEDTAVAAYL
jgi:hypothetical protein